MSGRLTRLVLQLRRNLGAGAPLDRLLRRVAAVAGPLGADLDLLAALYGTDKFGAHEYTPVYRELMGAARRKPVRLLEIGVGGYEGSLGGESLRMWASYFRRGRIFAITEKLFPILIGDGKSTLTELIWSDSRARFMADKFLQRFSERQNEVLSAGEELKLVEAGNHAQGCIFRDGMRLCTAELESRLDEISQKLNGFFIGRYDIRYASEKDLRGGGNFQIIELNGAASEATSIYDARN